MAAGPTVVLYTAGWCRVCADVAPRTRRIAEDYETVHFATVDVEQHPDAPVMGVPTLTVRDGDGAETARKVGALSDSEIEALFEAAVTGRRHAGSTDRQTRAIRVAAGAALVTLGILSSSLIVALLGVAAGAWGVADLVGGTSRDSG